MTDAPSAAPRDDALWTHGEVARFLRVRPMTVRSWVRAGQMPAPTKLNRLVRWDPEVIQGVGRRHGRPGFRVRPLPLADFVPGDDSGFVLYENAHGSGRYTRAVSRDQCSPAGGAGLENIERSHELCHLLPRKSNGQCGWAPPGFTRKPDQPLPPSAP
jgi:hypothetical protein